MTTAQGRSGVRNASARRLSVRLGSALFVCSLALLSACGGKGGGGSSSADAPAPTPSPPPEPVVAPSIVAQPQAASVTEGNAAVFNVTVSGTAPLRYQWRRNGNAITGATSPTYTVVNTALSDSGATFSVVVSNDGGAATSNAAALTVNTAMVAPSISTQPQSVSVVAGATASFSVTAAGTAPLSYQWRRDGVDIAGATSASYTTPATVLGDNGASYTVVVTNGVNGVTSSAATLTVTAAAVAPSIVTQPADRSVIAGETASFSVTASGSAPLVYQWRRNGADIAGATAASYTTPATTRAADDGAVFSVLVTNAAGNMLSSPALLSVAELPTVTAIAASGGGFSLALKSNGTVIGWGDAQRGQLAQGPNPASPQLAPVRMQASSGVTLSGISAVSAGDYHTLLLKTDGSVLATGWNDFGQIGDNTTTTRNFPVPVQDQSGAALTNVSRVAAGGVHSLALKNDGTVWAWGWNFYGQLGDGSTTNRTRAVQVTLSGGTPLSDVIAIAANGSHSMALRSDGTVWTWGNNVYGALGDGSLTSRSNPVRVETSSGVALSSVVAIAAGTVHSLAVRSDGSVMGWGTNSQGMLCDGSTVGRLRPVAARDSNGLPITGVTAAVAGAFYSVLLRSNGSLLACGYNADGRLADGTTTSPRTTPVPVLESGGGAFANANRVSLQFQHVLVRKSDGSVWSWGDNGSGQLGDGSVLNRAVPVQVPN